MNDSQTTLFLIVAILLLALWRSGKLERILAVAFKG